MTDLVSSLSSALDKREELAKAATPAPWEAEVDPEASPGVWVDFGAELGFDVDRPADAAFIAANDPSWVLRDCEAKRRVLARHALRQYAMPHPVRLCEGCSITEGSAVLTFVEWPCPEVRDVAYSLNVEVPQ